MIIREEKRRGRRNTVHVDSDQAREIDFHRQRNQVNNQNHSEQIV